MSRGSEDNLNKMELLEAQKQIEKLTKEKSQLTPIMDSLKKEIQETRSTWAEAIENVRNEERERFEL